MEGQTAGSYRIVRRIGEGGMGAVYLGEHVMLGRPAAIKVLLPALSQNREIVGRFFNEARAATAIRHPGIVEIYDFGYLADGAAYIAMEMLDGESLAARLRRAQRLPAAQIVAIGRQIASALHAAHGKAIIHRDLKPDNAFLIQDPEIGERVKLLDFGIAKLVADEAGGRRTRTGVVMGTPVYMSPEQCRGATDLDHRADLYSLGCMLYELAAGRPPFTADSAGELMAHHLYFEPETVSRHAGPLPAGLEALIMALLAKQPAQRPASAAEVVTALDACAAGVSPVAWTTPAPASAAQSAWTTSAPASQPPGSQPPGSQPPASQPPASATAATTLGVATASVPAAPSRRRRALWLGGATLAAAAVVVAVLATRPSPAPSSISSQASTGAASIAPPAAAPAPTTASVPSAPQPAVVAPSEAASPAAAAAVTPPAAAAPDVAIARPARAAAKKPDARKHATAEPTPVPDPALTATAPPAQAAAVPPAPPAQAASSAPPSKWTKLTRDKSSANVEIEDLLLRLRVAAGRGDCVTVRTLAAQIRAKDVATYQGRIASDSTVSDCLK